MFCSSFDLNYFYHSIRPIASSSLGTIVPASLE
jgi:hypothetical protein